jgi:hypothetical protein
MKDKEIKKLNNIDFSQYDLESIDKENFKKCEGILDISDTNYGFAQRNYQKPCRTVYKIAVVHGWWVWWCSCHHQPIYVCDKQRMIIKAKEKLPELIIGMLEWEC